MTVYWNLTLKKIPENYKHLNFREVNAESLDELRTKLHEDIDLFFEKVNSKLKNDS